MSITIKEIAELAGVSRGTVDRALRNSPKINADTKKRVIQIVEQNNYKPNYVGRALAKSKKQIKIAVITNSIGNAFFDEVFNGIKTAEKDFENFGIRTTIFEIKGYDINLQLSAISKIKCTDFDALIITPINDKKIACALENLSDSGVAIVAMNTDIKFEGKLCYVGCDYTKSGRTICGLANMLIHEKCDILLTTGSMDVMGHKERVIGLLEMSKSNKNIGNIQIIEHNDDEEISYNKVLESLASNRKIKFVCTTAGGVEGAVKATSEIDDNIRIVSFDLTAKVIEGFNQDRILATIVQQPYDQGYIAVKCIYENLFNGVVFGTDIYTDISIKIKQNL